MENINWDKVLLALEKVIDKDSFEGWIKHLSYKSTNGIIANLTAPSQFIKNWILGNYKEHIITAIKQQSPNIDTINISISSDWNSTPSTIAEGASEEKIPTSSTISSNPTSSPFSNSKIYFKLDPRYTFDNFIVGKSNEFAYTAAKRIATNPVVSFNPLFMYGGVGLGKTHLMHSIAWYITQNTPERKCLYLSAEKFMQLFIQALRDKDIFSFKQMFRNTDVLMIDDFQFISGKEQTQEEFFHSFNSLMEQGKQIVLCADKSPSSLSKIEDRIMSRLNAGLVADIHATTYELRIGILESKIKQLKIKVPQDVIKFLASSITSNVRELEGALAMIKFNHTEMHKKINLEMAMESISEIIKTNNKSISVDQIQKVICEHFSIKFSDLLSNKRTKDIAHARQIAMYLSKKLTSLSFAEIGKKFGGKDHTTVLYATDKIEKNKQSDSELSENLSLLERIIKY